MPAKNTQSQQAALAGQAVYSATVLKLYDWWVLGISNRWIWQCPTPHLLKHFNDHVTSNHLDVGVGTGYFLDHAQFPSATPRLALLDLNPTCLQVTAKRVARYTPTLYHANVLEPLNLDAPRFDSISITYLLHCLPGAIQGKGVVFEHLLPLLNTGGIIFGATLLGNGVERNWAARQLMEFYNAKKIFSNVDDDLKSLQEVLHQYFAAPSIEVKGCAALFSGRIS